MVKKMRERVFKALKFFGKRGGQNWVKKKRANRNFC